MKQKEYTIKNKQKIKEHKSLTYLCICGSTSTISHKCRHEKSKKHQNFIHNLNKESQTIQLIKEKIKGSGYELPKLKTKGDKHNYVLKLFKSI